MKKDSSARPALAAAIAALYAALTAATAFMASGAVQLRLSEALCILPAFTPAGIPGVTLRCFLANLLTGAPAPDILFGTAATLLAALGTYALRERKRLRLMPPVLANTLILPFVFRLAYGMPGPWYIYAPAVFLGEALSAGLLGGLLGSFIERNDYLRGMLSGK